MTRNLGPLAALASCAIAGVCLAGAAGADELDDAYTRELTLLRAERDALRAELARAREEGAERTAAMTDSLDEDSDALARLRGTATDLEREIRAVDARRSAAGAQAELVVATLEHARDMLRANDVEVTPQDSSVTATLDTLFAAGVHLVDEMGRIRVEEGTFFTEAGIETRGTIVHLGAVAALAADPDVGGLLEPVGEDAWRVARSDGGRAAREVLEASIGDRVAVRLSDPNEPLATGKGRRDLLERVRNGGPIVWPILLLALVAAAIVIERAVTLRRIDRGTDRVGNAVGQAVRAGKFDDAERACARDPGAVAHVLAAVLGRRDASRERLDDALNEAMMNEMPALERFLPTLRVIAAVTPLLGLLGTVTGMISTFDVITQFGTGDPKLLSGGISEALITTELGLAVAIPALLLHSMLSGRVDRVVDHMETRGLELVLALHDAVDRR